MINDKHFDESTRAVCKTFVSRMKVDSDDDGGFSLFQFYFMLGKLKLWLANKLKELFKRIMVSVNPFRKCNHNCGQLVIKCM